MRRISGSLAAVWFCLSCFVCTSQPKDPIKNLHEQSLVWDAHSDIVQSIMMQDLVFSEWNEVSFEDIPRMQAGGLDVQVFSLWPDPIYYPRAAAHRTLEMLDVQLRAFDRSADKIELARTAADVERITRSGKIAALLAIEGGHAIEDDLGLLRMFHRLGISSMTLTHTKSIGWADSSGGEALSDGLNEFGEEVVHEMNRLGMVIDVSHVSDATFYDVMRTSRHPVIASHSNCRALSDHRRNLTDEMILALAENGGVQCITCEPNYLSQGYWDARRKKIQEIDAADETPEIRPEDLDEWAVQRELAPRIIPEYPFPTIEDVFRHIEHVVQLVGVDHVGLGHDYSIMYKGPAGLEDVSKYENITRGLRERGYSDEDTKKILGGNLLRVWRAVTDSSSPKQSINMR